MSQFKLANAEGDPLDLDSATGAVASYLGMTESNGVKDTQEIGPGERTSVVLVFVPPADATGLTLEAGDASLPLAAGATGQSGSGQVAQSTDLSAQLLVNNFEQFSIVTPTATPERQDGAGLREPVGCRMSGTFRVAPAIHFGYGVSDQTGELVRSLGRLARAAGDRRGYPRGRHLRADRSVAGGQRHRVRHLRSGQPESA